MGTLVRHRCRARSGSCFWGASAVGGGQTSGVVTANWSFALYPVPRGVTPGLLAWDPPDTTGPRARPLGAPGAVETPEAVTTSFPPSLQVPAFCPPYRRRSGAAGSRSSPARCSATRQTPEATPGPRCGSSGRRWIRFRHHRHQLGPAAARRSLTSRSPVVADSTMLAAAARPRRSDAFLQGRPARGRAPRLDFRRNCVNSVARWAQTAIQAPAPCPTWEGPSFSCCMARGNRRQPPQAQAQGAWPTRARPESPQCRPTRAGYQYLNLAAGVRRRQHRLPSRRPGPRPTGDNGPRSTRTRSSLANHSCSPPGRKR